MQHNAKGPIEYCVDLRSVVKQAQIEELNRKDTDDVRGTSISFPAF